MAIITFPRKEVVALFTACIERNKPMTFVSSDGVYLALFGDKSKNIESVLVYGKGYNPELDDNWFESKRGSIGGDDFTQAFDGLDLQGFLDDKDWTVFRVHVTPSQIKLSVK